MSLIQPIKKVVRLADEDKLLQYMNLSLDIPTELCELIMSYIRLFGHRFQRSDGTSWVGSLCWNPEIVSSSITFRISGQSEKSYWRIGPHHESFEGYRRAFAIGKRMEELTIRMEVEEDQVTYRDLRDGTCFILGDTYFDFMSCFTKSKATARPIIRFYNCNIEISD